MRKYLSGPASYGLHGMLSGAWTGGQELKVGVLHMLHCAAFEGLSGQGRGARCHAVGY